MQVVDGSMSTIVYDDDVKRNFPVHGIIFIERKRLSLDQGNVTCKSQLPNYDR